MELHVFFRGPLPSKAALARQMRDLGFPLSLKPATGSLEQQTGLMPMRWQREDTGVEFDVWSTRAAIDEIRREGVDPAFDRSANFRWGGEESELLCALCAVAALAKLTGGVVFDPEEDRLQSVEEAIEAARATLQRLAKPEKPPGTTVSDLRRYLKPLLKQRSDLMLLGRLLLIRPVRHIVRGALFEGSHGSFHLTPYAWPLYGAPRQTGDRIMRVPEVWQPHFQPVLIDILREDIFADVGQVADLACFAERVRNGWNGITDPDEYIVACRLVGREMEAEAYLAERGRKAVEGSYLSEWVGETRQLLDRDIASLCADYHGREARAAESMKLGDAWEPSPFPVELPPAERVAKSNDPPFSVAPWIQTPEGMIDPPPELPGHVAFANDILHRRGGIFLQSPMTRDQADEMHRGNESYCLVTRLDRGHLLVLERRIDHSPRAPKPWWLPPGYVPSVSYYLRIFAEGEQLTAAFHGDREEHGMLNLWNIMLRRDRQSKECLIQYSRQDRSKTVHGGPDADYAVTPIAEDETALRRFPFPEFGEYQGMVDRVYASLAINGLRQPV